MKLSRKEHRCFNKHLKPYLNHSITNKMHDFIQHGSTSTYKHCHDVAEMSLWVNRRLRLKADESTLLPAAFLHDLYLYDWHIPGNNNNLHGYTHADIAGDNAVKYFSINKKTEAVIRSHMWPLNISRVPKSREAWIVCLCDKAVSVREMVRDALTSPKDKSVKKVSSFSVLKNTASNMINNAIRG